MSERAARSVALPMSIDLDSLSGLRDELIAAVASGAVSLTCAGVERVSTNGLMLLLSAAETARSNGVVFELHEPSATMRAAIDRLGLGERFAGLLKG